MAEPSPAPPHIPPAAALHSAPAHQLRYEVARQAKLQRDPRALGASNPKARLLSNKMHYRPTDPEARISVKPGKARALNYLCSLAVDPATGVISYNLKKLLNHQPKRRVSLALALQPASLGLLKRFFEPCLR